MTVATNNLGQADILNILRSDGYDVNIRTLRYWRTVGLLPQLYNRGYPIEIIDTIKELCNKFGRLIGDVILIITLEGGYRFKVYRYIVERPKEDKGKYKLTFYTDQGIIIEKRDNLDGLLRRSYV